MNLEHAEKMKVMFAIKYSNVVEIDQNILTKVPDIDSLKLLKSIFAV